MHDALFSLRPDSAPCRPREVATQLASAGLAACVLGIVLCPFAYVAMGALSRFSSVVTMIGLPLVGTSSGYLLKRYLSKPNESKSTQIRLIAEAVCWHVSAAFLTIVSHFTLMTTLERIGLSVALAAACAVLCLPVVLLRQTSLRERLAQLQPHVGTGVLLVIVLAAFTTTLAHFLLPPGFI